MGTPAPLSNPRATLQVAQFDDRHFCLLVDDFLLNPDELVQFTADRRAEFNSVDFSYYPGVYRMAPADLADRPTDYFQSQARRRFDARRCVEAICRYSIVTLPPQLLHPIQWLCHRDDVGLDARLSMQASVLYLFRDPELGGSGDIAAPDRLSADPRSGRLTLNGFFTCRRNLA